MLANLWNSITVLELMVPWLVVLQLSVYAYKIRLSFDVVFWHVDLSSVQSIDTVWVIPRMKVTGRKGRIQSLQTDNAMGRYAYNGDTLIMEADNAMVTIVGCRLCLTTSTTLTTSAPTTTTSNYYSFTTSTILPTSSFTMTTFLDGGVMQWLAYSVWAISV